MGIRDARHVSRNCICRFVAGASGGEYNRQFKRLPGALHAEPGHARSAFASACQRALTTLSANFRLLAV